MLLTPMPSSIIAIDMCLTHNTFIVIFASSDTATFSFLVDLPSVYMFAFSVSMRCKERHTAIVPT